MTVPIPASSSNTSPTDLGHIFLIRNVHATGRGTEHGPLCLLFNAEKITKEKALEVLRSGNYSPYVLCIPQEQFDGLFLNQNTEMRDSLGLCALPETQSKASSASKPSGTLRKNLHAGDLVDIVLKKDQPSGKLTRGLVKDILTNSPEHHRGIKVRLQDGQVGRVQAIIRQSPPKEG